MTAVQAFCEALRDARQLRYRFTTYASIALDISRTSISEYEHGYRLPRVRTLKKLCDTYGADFDDLLILWARAKLERLGDNDE